MGGRTSREEQMLNDEDYLWQMIGKGNYRKVKKFFAKGKNIDWNHFVRRQTSPPKPCPAIPENSFGYDCSTRLPLQLLFSRYRTGRKMKKCKKFVKILLEEGLDPNLLDHEGKTALNQLVTNINYFRLYVHSYRKLKKLARRSCKVLELLGAHRADMMAGTEEDSLGRSPLHYAAMYSFTGSPEIFLKYGADLELKDNKGKTPLHLAALFGSSSTMDNLIECGADCFARTTDGENVLHLLIRGFSDSRNASYWTQRFLKRGVNVNGRDRHGNTPLHLAARLGPDDNVIVHLVRNGANPNAVNKKGRTPLYEYLDGAEMLTVSPTEAPLTYRHIESLVGFGCLINNMTGFQYSVYDHRGYMAAILQDPHMAPLRQRLLAKSIQPASLKHMSRQVIRRSLGLSRLVDKSPLSALELPSDLKKYICSKGYKETMTVEEWARYE